MELQNLMNYRRLVFFTIFISCSIIWVCYRNTDNVVYKYVTPSPIPIITSGPKYLVSSSKCMIPNLDPFNREVRPFYKPEKYTPCSKHALLTYVTKADNISTLHINKHALPSYKIQEITCCYSNVTPGCVKKEPDDGFCISRCQYFENNITFPSPTLLVKCHSGKKRKQIYSNIHTSVTFEDKLLPKMENSRTAGNFMSVLFVGIDSISRLNLIRALPKTYEYLKECNWTELQGYNKMGDNTFPNLAAILTGLNESTAYKTCNPKKVGSLDKCGFIWKEFNKLNYITAYAEDAASDISTFNDHKKGFVDPPTDFYFRPYVLAAETLESIKMASKMSTYCTGPETSGERILNVAKDFAVTFKNYSNFGFFWMNTFSHDELNDPTGMDARVRQFLKDITEKGVLENSMVVFLSDHGMRFGEYRYTRSGWLEERLPYMYISLPKWFQRKYPVEYSNLQNNTNKLTTPYDIFMTVQNALKFFNQNYTIHPSQGCPGCQSLFSEINANRSCEEGGIAQHWCTCAGYKTTPKNSPTVMQAVSVILNRIEDIKEKIPESNHCVKFHLKKVISASISDNSVEWYKNKTFILVVIETEPHAVFEGTVEEVSLNGSSTYTLSGGISRLDYYQSHRECVKDSYLKLYCYCYKRKLSREYFAKRSDHN